MTEFFQTLFDTYGFPARWECGTWTAGHGWLHIISDVAIFGAYAAIPAMLMCFIRRRKDVPFPPVFWLLATFILVGIGHLIDAMLFWHPLYRVSGLIKCVTAIVSWSTVIALIPILPKALSLPGLSKLNADLRTEVEQRRHAEARLHLVIEAAPNAMLMADAAGNITLLNSQAETLFGYDRLELIGQPIECLVAKRYRGGDDGGFLAGARSFKMGGGRDLYGLRKDGSEMPIELGLNPIATPDGAGILAAIIDITERKRTEERLRRKSHELERSNQELERFAFVASHDLQEPARKVQAFGDRLAAVCHEALNEQGRDYLTRMQNAAERMQLLVADLLELSRVTRHPQPFQPVSLAEITRQVLSDLEMRVLATGATIQVDRLPSLDADPTQMRQLLQNLIGNALKFHGGLRPPQVRIRAEVCMAVCSQAASDAMRATSAPMPLEAHIHLMVEDNGIGFEPRYAARLFDPFQRLHGRSEYEGTGMGLAICRKIVERHRGTIAAIGRPGAGATFIAVLPLQQSREEREVREHENRDRVRPYTYRRG